MSWDYFSLTGTLRIGEKKKPYFGLGTRSCNLKTNSFAITKNTQ
jgi:hypothetical protein